MKEGDFPTLGKPKTNLSNNLNWRQAAKKGAEAPPPPQFIKKMPHKKDDSFDEIDLDDFDEEEYDPTQYCSDDDAFPAKGGYID